MRVSDLSVESISNDVNNFISSSQLFAFPWSNENKLFLKIKTNEIIESLIHKMNVFKEAFEFNEFEILFDRIHIVMLEKSADSKQFVISSFTQINGNIDIEHYDKSKAVFKQVVTEEDFIYEILNHYAKALEKIEMSIEVKTVVKHHLVSLKKTASRYHCNKRIKA